MQTIKDWLAQPEIQKIKDQPVRKLLSDSINRDPMRPIYYDPDVFYSPADGVILYNEIVRPGENIIEVKGEKYTTERLLQEEIKETCLVIGIFMSCLDVHVNRIPTDGFLWHKHLEPLKVMNLSMRSIENSILEEMEIDPKNLNYALYNERVINKVVYPKIKGHYFICQIADFEVEVVATFGQQNDHYTQGERFSVVRLGSQCDLIIPLINKKIKFESLAKVNFHVEAGLDKLIQIHSKEVVDQVEAEVEHKKKIINPLKEKSLNPFLDKQWKGAPEDDETFFYFDEAGKKEVLDAEGRPIMDEDGKKIYED